MYPYTTHTHTQKQTIKSSAESASYRLVVPEEHASIVTAAKHDAILVHGKRVYDGIVPGKVLDKVAAGTLPLPRKSLKPHTCTCTRTYLLDVVWAGRGKGKVCGGERERTHALFVVGQRGQRLAGGQIPQPRI